MKLKISNYKTVLILFIIVLIAGLLRFWQLSSHPVSLSIDEVAVGYNAYSILKTGRDEHGDFLPLSFLSVGDYKPPLHIYLAVPTVAIFGLNELGVRFSMALFSTLTVISVFLLVSQLTKNESIALLASFLTAISPWHIQFARFSYEVSLGLFLIVTGVWLFLRVITQGRLLWLSAILFVLSMYSYHAERIFTPLLVLGLIIIFRRSLLKHKIALIKAIIIGGVLLIPLVYILLGPAGQTRARSVFINKDPEIQNQLHKQEATQNIAGLVFNNNLLIITNHWAKQYLDYFDPKFLFFSGMKLAQPGRQDVGLLYLFELPFLIIGVWLIFIKRVFINRIVILYWLMIGPLVASLTIEDQHVSRSLVTLPMPQLLIAAGIWRVWQLIKNFNLQIKTCILSLGSIILILSVGYYLHLYYIHFPVEFSEFWQYGWKEAAIYGWENKDKYHEIVVDPTFGSEGPLLVGTPPAYFLFYGKYDPSSYQTSPRRTEKLSTNFENFTFRPIYWPADKGRSKTLFIGSPWVLPRKDINESQIKKVIKFKNGVDGILIVESQGNERIPLE